MHYGIQEFISIDDLLKKIGKVNRMFGKGGMVNTTAVQTKILTDWYQGKLNYIFE
jgi:ribosome biogenesis GTPase A